jgi:hypothetical protein
MPYFVYKIEPPRTLTYVDTKTAYKEARELVRALRKDHPQGADVEFRMTFAKSQGEAERLLSTPRDERVIGED